MIDAVEFGHHDDWAGYDTEVEKLECIVCGHKTHGRGLGLIERKEPEEE